MGIEHLSTVGRNDACWCGSGQKYKKCHRSGDEAAARAALPAPRAATPEARAAAPEAQAPDNPPIDRKLVTTIGLIALAALVAVTFLRDIGDGLIAGLAVLIVGAGYAILRDPPAPHRDKAEGTQLTFGINPPQDPPANAPAPAPRVVRGPVPPPPRTRRKPR